MALYLSKQQECFTQAFLYKWTHIPSQKWYVGSRTAPGCNTNDGYICSSKTVKPMIIENREEWIREILCIADSSYIISLETDYLKLVDAKNDPMSFNRHNGDGKFTSTGKIVSDATKLKMSKARVGIKKSTEHRLALSKAHKNAEYLLHRPVRYGNKSPRFVGYYISPNEEKFASAYVAASASGVSAPTIRKWANNNLNGWKFQPKVEV